MLLAAGKSQRLKGFAEGLPKVMLEVAGRSILEHNLRYLKKNGVTEVVINLHYRPRVIRDFIRKKGAFGMRVHFSDERKLQGTAGGVKKARKFLGNKPFFVMYGDNLMDFDLRDMARFHKKKKSSLTLAVYHPAKTDWSGVAAGLIKIGPKKDILAFEERRGNRRVAPDRWVNAGLILMSPTILKEIPDRRVFDFSRDLFPEWLQSGRPLYGYSGARYVLASDTVPAWRKTNRLARKRIKEEKHA